MYDHVIKLVKETKKTDARGNLVPEKETREVFVELKSIGQSEFYQAQAMGLKPEIKFLLPDYLEYQDEKTILFQDYNSDEELEYTVIRTYRNGNQLEIVCKKGID